MRFVDKIEKNGGKIKLMLMSRDKAGLLEVEVVCEKNLRGLFL